MPLSPSTLPPPGPKTPNIPTFYSGIILNGIDYKLWTRGRTFDRRSYFTALANLPDLEAQIRRCEIPSSRATETRKFVQARGHLESLVLEYLFSDEGGEDKEKFELLMNPDNTTGNARLYKSLEAYLAEHKEEQRVKGVAIDFKMWKRNEAIVSAAGPGSWIPRCGHVMLIPLCARRSRDGRKMLAVRGKRKGWKRGGARRSSRAGTRRSSGKALDNGALWRTGSVGYFEDRDRGCVLLECTVLRDFGGRIIRWAGVHQITGILCPGHPLWSSFISSAVNDTSPSDSPSCDSGS